jgi:hypothetical protein
MSDVPEKGDAGGAEDDKILDALRGAAREIEHIDPRWLALAEGKLAPWEAERLREEAEQTEDGRLLWGLFRLFSATEKPPTIDGASTRSPGTTS